MFLLYRKCHFYVTDLYLSPIATPLVKYLLFYFPPKGSSIYISLLETYYSSVYLIAESFTSLFLDKLLFLLDNRSSPTEYSNKVWTHCFQRV